MTFKDLIKLIGTKSEDLNKELIFRNYNEEDDISIYEVIDVTNDKIILG